MADELVTRSLTPSEQEEERRADAKLKRANIALREAAVGRRSRCGGASPR